MSSSRIIGDFLEINSDIVQAEFNSKLPKFIKKYKFRKQRKRLLDNVSKLRDSGIVLETDNIVELFSYIYNNFYPETSYKSIEKCKINTDIEAYEGIIKFDNIVSIITIEKDIYPKFNINTKINVSNGISQGINIEIDRLYSDNTKKNDILSRVNSELVNVICDYIEDIIKPYYNNKEDNNEVIEESVLGINV